MAETRAMDDDTKAAWAVVEEAAKDSPLYNGTVHSALNELRSRLSTPREPEVGKVDAGVSSVFRVFPGDSWREGDLRTVVHAAQAPYRIFRPDAAPPPDSEVREALEELQERLTYHASSGRKWCDACEADKPLPHHADDCPFRRLLQEGGG